MRIAFLDFDGTITDRDSLLEFIKFARGKNRFWIGFALCSPWIAAWKGGLLSNQQAKERVLRFFFRGMRIDEFERLCRDFSQTRLPQLIRPKALTEIRLLQEQGFAVVVVSASPQDWIVYWTKEAGAALIASRLATRQSAPKRPPAPDLTGGAILTGRIDGKNCHGNEKVARIRAEYRLEDYGAIYTYGDSKGDRPMLALGTRSFFKPFR